MVTQLVDGDGRNACARVLTVAVLSGLLLPGVVPPAQAGDEYAGQFNYGQTKGEGKAWVQAIQVLAPAYRSAISGTVKIVFKAPGMDRAEARCWHQPDEQHPDAWGYDAVVLPGREIDGNAETSFEFPADQFPHGPTALRISTVNAAGKRDVCELQLYNEGGVKFRQGVPAADPPGAKGMYLLFADDFNAMPKITPMGLDGTYAAHKPPNGDFSGWRFSHKDDYEGAHDPFEQKDTWLRIKARSTGNQKTDGSGLISSARFDGTGVFATPPCYLECRFVAQSAPGTWPAFWTLAVKDKECDELDIIEGYGGVGPGNPNSTDYHIVTHFWGQKDANGKEKKGFHRTVPVTEMCGKGLWSATAHTYGVMIGEEETVYYFDDLEVLRHPTGTISIGTPAFFLINYAIGGISGWKIDLKRYGNGSDMWVDYVRVYSGRAPTPEITPAGGFIFDKPASVALSCALPQAAIHYTTDGTEPTGASPRYTGPLSLAQPCTVKAIAVDERFKPGRVAVAEVRKARAPDAPGETQPGLNCAYYQGTWEALPAFDKLTPAAKSTVPDFVLPEPRQQDHFACRYTGFIEVPATGVYTFYTNSDDGSQLFIGGERVVDNDGLHGAIQRSGLVGLLAGKHAIEVRYFEAWGGESLLVSWSGPGLERTPIPAAVLSHQPAPSEAAVVTPPK
jgi:hypothetical protein